MTNFRLLRHLSYANLMASIAVFVALGGVGYAATSINGNDITKRTVGANKLKDGTLTSKQVKQNALNGGVIEESSLATVPSAQTAVFATSAMSANNAASAEHALSADRATEATTAGRAATAADAETLDGLTSKQLQVTCPAETDPYGGMCWDGDVRPADDWIGASVECGDAGGRLPSLSELIAYLFQDGTQVTSQNWSADVFDLVSGKEHVLTSDETTTGASESSPTQLGYRCLFYRTN